MIFSPRFARAKSYSHEQVSVWESSLSAKNRVMGLHGAHSLWRLINTGVSRNQQRQLPFGKGLFTPSLPLFHMVSPRENSYFHTSYSQLVTSSEEMAISRFSNSRLSIFTKKSLRHGYPQRRERFLRIDGFYPTIGFPYRHFGQFGIVSPPS